MKFPNHLILDLNNFNNNICTNYWIYKSTNLFENFFFFNFLLLKKKNLLLNNGFNLSKFNIILFNQTYLWKNYNFNFFKNKINNLLLKKFSTYNYFNIIFLKKEKIYTKLKYSRVPQYDIVSGGAAALFSGFLGFLISEKFGVELVDSGDFYILFMYLVFIAFFLKPLVKIMSNTNNSWLFLSFKWFFLFYKNLLLLLINYFNKFKN